MLTQYFVGFCLWVLMRRTRVRELVVNYIKQLLDRDENMLQHSAPDTFWRKGFESRYIRRVSIQETSLDTLDESRYIT